MRAARLSALILLAVSAAVAILSGGADPDITLAASCGMAAGVGALVAFRPTRKPPAE